MTVAPFRFRAALVAIILVSLGMAGDPSATATYAAKSAIPEPTESHLRHEPDGLGMRRPYQPGKIPVVLIHGLWGFPHHWDGIIRELESDPIIRARYQFWTFSYASGDSVPFSAHLLRQSLRRARRLYDPDGTDAAFDRMVLVGHSLGGILAKMMAQDSTSRIWQTVSNRAIEQLVGPPEDRELIHQAYCYEPVPEVKRLIFIATPHRGSPLVRGVVRSIGKQFCDRASTFRQARAALLAQNETDFFLPGFRRECPTSVSELAREHPLLAALCELGIDKSVLSHSIIADLRDPPAPGASDGIVPYSSSHLESAGSEKLFHAYHVCLDNPALNQEVRRILLEHAGTERVSTHLKQLTPMEDPSDGNDSQCSGAAQQANSDGEGRRDDQHGVRYDRHE
jgi:pimeloyl-ACP methyl ester carboxylesterase